MRRAAVVAVPRRARRRSARLLVAVVLLGATSVGCASEADDAWRGEPGGSLRRLTAGGEPAVLYLPDGDVQGLAIYHHGAGETVEGFVDLQTDRTLVGRLLEVGWAVAASEAHGDHWGSQAGVDANAALWEVLERELDVERVVLVAHSMGGLSSLTCIVQACVPDVDAWIGIYPLVDQRTMVRSSIAAAALPAIEERFHGAPPPELIPLEQAGELTGVPLLMWASPDDTVVPMAGNATALARRVEAGGGRAEVRAATGEHGDPSHYDLDAVLDLLADL